LVEIEVVEALVRPPLEVVGDRGVGRLELCVGELLNQRSFVQEPFRSEPSLEEGEVIAGPVIADDRSGASRGAVASYGLGQLVQPSKKWERAEVLFAGPGDVDGEVGRAAEIDVVREDPISVAPHLPARQLLVGEGVVGRLRLGTPVEVDHALLRIAVHGVGAFCGPPEWGQKRDRQKTMENASGSRHGVSSLCQACSTFGGESHREQREDAEGRLPHSMNLKVESSASYVGSSRARDGGWSIVI